MAHCNQGRAVSRRAGLFAAAVWCHDYVDAVSDERLMAQPPDTNAPTTPGRGRPRRDGCGVLVYLFLGVAGVTLAFFAGWFILADRHPGVSVNVDTGIAFGLKPDEDPARSTFTSAVRTPRWMPDGQSIIVGIGHGIYRVSANDTTAKQKIIEAKNSKLYSPSLPTDGSKITYLSYRQTNNPFRPPNLWHVWIADMDGQKAERITKALTHSSDPYLSPDGTVVALIPGSEGNKLTVITADGSPVAEPAQDSCQSVPLWATWSRDGQRLALFHWKQITTFDLGTGTCSVVAEVGGPYSHVSRPAWSSSNDRLYYIGRAGGIDADEQPTNPSYLYSVRFDGTERQVIADLSKEPLLPVETLEISPDGQRLLLVGISYEIYVNEIYVMNVDGTGLRMIHYSDSPIRPGSDNPITLGSPIPITPGSEASPQFLYASWSPDGSQIAVHNTASNGISVHPVPKR